jgi:nuclear migration protein JNM1
MGDLTEDEDESLERRLARLRREAEEVKLELERRRAQNEEDGNPNADGDSEYIDDGVEGLNRLLDTLNSSARGGRTPTSVEASLSKKIATGPKPSLKGTDGLEPSTPVEHSAEQSTSSILFQAAAFDRRLTLLETFLGAPAVSTTSSSSNPQMNPILPTLGTLSNQLTILTTTIASATSTTPTHLDEISTRIRNLTANAEALTTARKRAMAAAKEAADAESHGPTPSSPSKRRHSHKGSTSAVASPAILEDSSHTAKIHALYTTLPTINNLSPVLPSVLERLRSLRSMHAGAATAADDLEALENGQEELMADVARWREGLEEVEKKVRDGEKAMGKNLDTVGWWVGGLEERLKGLQ